MSGGLPSCDDTVIVVDADDRETGRVGKLDAHRPPGVRHRAFSLMIRRHGEWLLQQRASTKYHFAGLWSNSCCSHPRPGEDVLAAARRRLHEELGMTAESFRQVGRFEYVAHDPSSGLVEHEIVHVVVARAVTEPHPSPAEVDRVRWCRTAQLVEAIDRRPSSFTPWLPDVVSLIADHDRRAPVRGGR